MGAGNQILQCGQSKMAVTSAAAARQSNAVLDSVIYGDCFKIMPKLAAGSIDLIVTDPPYAVSDTKTRYTICDGTTGQRRTRSGNFGPWDLFASPLEFRRWLLSAVNEMLRVLKPGGVLALFCQDRLLSHLTDHLEAGGHRLINTFVFRKKNPFPLLRKVGWQHALEFGVIAAKQGARHTFNSGLGYQSNCLTAAVHYGKERLFGAHPSQKPEVIIEPLLNYFSRPGDLVLDPFAGSGTTAVVAKRLGRHFVGIEQNNAFVRLANDRLKALTAEMAQVACPRLVRPPAR